MLRLKYHVLAHKVLVSLIFKIIHGHIFKSQNNINISFHANYKKNKNNLNPQLVGYFATVNMQDFENLSSHGAITAHIKWLNL